MLLVSVIEKALVRVSKVVLGLMIVGVGLEVVLIGWVSRNWYKYFNIHIIGSRILVVRKHSADVGIM